MEWFQSSSGLSTGCYYKIRHKGYMTGMFQSSSGLLTGCYQAFREAGRLLGVSILIRPFDRMLLFKDQEQVMQAMSFNPHPAFRPDATRGTGWLYCCDSPFQSSSGLSTGCYCHAWFSYLTSANLQRRSLKFLFSKRFLHVLRLVFSYGREPQG